jgi:hypothetical protein
MKSCTKCGSTSNGFHSQRGHKDGLTSQCKTCRIDGKTKDKRLLRNYQRKHMYGITPAMFQSMLEVQDNKCANEGCQAELTDESKTHVDHDHSCCPGTRSCGKCVRALLCAECNLGIGQFRDNPFKVYGAYRYLVSHEHLPSDSTLFLGYGI